MATADLHIESRFDLYMVGSIDSPQGYSIQITNRHTSVDKLIRQVDVARGRSRRMLDNQDYLSDLAHVFLMFNLCIRAKHV